MTKDPLDIDDCWNASSIRAKIKDLKIMSGYAFDRAGETFAVLRELEKRLAALDEEE